MVPLVIPLVPMVPLVKTVGSQYCRHSTVWAKLPSLESKDVIECSNIRIFVFRSNIRIRFMNSNIRIFYLSPRCASLCFQMKDYTPALKGE